MTCDTVSFWIRNPALTISQQGTWWIKEQLYFYSCFSFIVWLLWEFTVTWGKQHMLVVWELMYEKWIRNISSTLILRVQIATTIRGRPHCLLSFQALSSTPCQRKKMLHHFLKKKMCEHFMNMGHAETFLWGPCEHSMQLKLFLCYIQQILQFSGLCVSLWNTLQPDCYINKFYPFLHHQLFFCLKVNFVCLLFCLIGFIQ